MSGIDGPGKDLADKKSKSWIPKGAVGLSVALHLFLLLMVGGVVLVEGTIPRQFMEASVDAVPSVDTQQTEIPEPSPEQSPDSVDVPQPAEMPSSAPQGIEMISTPEMMPTQSVALPVQMGPSSLTGAFGNTGPGTPETASVKPVSAPPKMMSIFGSTSVPSTALEGTFYDLKQTAEGKPTGMDENKVGEFLKDVVSRNWSASLFEKYFQGKDKLRTETIFIPETLSLEATKAFNLNQVDPTFWIIVYQGNFTVPESDQYRFVGRGDNMLFVNVGGKTVFDGDLFTNSPSPSKFTKLEQESYPTMIFGTKYTANVGPWQNWKKGETMPIKILIGEKGGGNTFAFLLIEQKSKTYAKSPQGYPILPPFSLGPVTGFAKGPGNVPKVMENGPVFKP